MRREKAHQSRIAMMERIHGIVQVRQQRGSVGKGGETVVVGGRGVSEGHHDRMFLGQGGDGGKGTFQFRSHGDDFDVVPFRRQFIMVIFVIVVVVVVTVFGCSVGYAVDVFDGLDAIDRRANVTLIVRPSFGRCEERSFQVHPQNVGSHGVIIPMAFACTFTFTFTFTVTFTLNCNFTFTFTFTFISIV